MWYVLWKYFFLSRRDLCRISLFQTTGLQVQSAYWFMYFLSQYIHQIANPFVDCSCIYPFYLQGQIASKINICMSSQQRELVYTLPLRQEVPKLMYALWKCKPVKLKLDFKSDKFSCTCTTTCSLNPLV